MRIQDWSIGVHQFERNYDALHWLLPRAALGGADEELSASPLLSSSFDSSSLAIVCEKILSVGVHGIAGENDPDLTSRSSISLKSWSPYFYRAQGEGGQ